MGPLLRVRAEAYSEGPVRRRSQNQPGHRNGPAGQLLRVRAGGEVLVVEHREGNGGQVKNAYVHIKLVGQGTKDRSLGRTVAEENGLDDDRVGVGGVVKLECAFLEGCWGEA